MAYRDGRRSLMYLLLVASSIVIGVAALVSINSFKENVEQAVDENAKPLVGADLVVKSRSAFTPEAEQVFRTIDGEVSHEATFASMVYFEASQGSRLVQVNALSGEFPYYGDLETEPPSAQHSFRKGGEAIVDQGLMLQFEAKVGDYIKLGQSRFLIAGILKRVPGVVDARNAIAPRIYIAHSDLEATQLISRGSRVRYKKYFKLKDSLAAERIARERKQKFISLGLSVETIETRKEWLNRSLRSAYAFLDLVGFVALILGGIGVGGATQTYLQKKERSISLLRCVGATSSDIYRIFLLQLLSFGGLSILVGVLLGVGIQLVLPFLFKAFLPVDVDVFVSFKAIALSAGVSLAILFLFAYPALQRAKFIPPLAVLRASVVGTADARSGGYKVWFLILLCSTLFAILHSGEIKTGLLFSGTVFLSWGLLLLLANFLIGLIKRYLPSRSPYSLRQGFANLYRPQNQTRLLIASVGISVFLMCLVFVSENAVLGKASELGSGKQANMILFDIQPDQRQSVETLVKDSGLTVVETVPLVTMRLDAVNGVPVKELRAKKEDKEHDWIYTREYRSTYRAKMTDAEELLEGSWVEEVSPGEEVIPVSAEKRIAERLGVGVGDRLSFNVQGVIVEARVANIRDVDWQRVQPNFFMVFPAGSLENAPQIFVLVAQAQEEAHSAALQKASVKQFPNVSIIDFRLVLKTVDLIVERLSLVLRWIALFSVAAAAVVLFVAVLATRNQRTSENALLKTLGASRRVVLQITMWEYLILGLLAASGGAVFGVLSGGLLSYYVFESAFVWTIGPVLLVTSLTVVVTLLLGLIGSEGTYRVGALEVLRREY